MTLPKRELTGEPAGEGSGSSSGSGNGNRLRDFRLDRLEVSTNNTSMDVSHGLPRPPVAGHPYRSSRNAPAMAPAAQMLTRP